MFSNDFSNINTLEFYNQFFSEIPEKSGVYYWVFWPFKDYCLEDENFEIFIEKIKYFSSVNMNLPESTDVGYKFSIEIRERALDCEIFGLNNNKSEKLIKHLQESRINRDFFLIYLKRIVFSKPFYIGKANNLRNRLQQHFDQRNSDILNHLKEFNINYIDVLIGYEIIESNLEENINTIFEEIAQRILKPGLTKRPG